ncbi:MAG: GNAT family N-acetyltransferase [Ilumatobacter sp.]
MRLTTIETERLRLHPLSVADAADMVAVLADESLYEFTGGEPPDLDTLQRRYRSQVAGSGADDEIWCNWIIHTTVDAAAVGFVQADVNTTSTELAWVVGIAAQGTGIGTEAATAVREWLAGEGVERFCAHIRPDHLASQLVAERIGLTRTGELDDDGEEIWASAAAPG